MARLMAIALYWLYKASAHAAGGEAANLPMSATKPVTSRIVQVHDPTRCERAESRHTWSRARPTRPSVTQTMIMTQRTCSSAGEVSAIQTMRPRLRAIRKV
eukprot:scaffold139410_cov109-Phaeocystis_antarctica.AAC.1